ncbi:Zn(II)2Cys6 transcription factor [Aspergillus floccosus]
MGDSSENKLLPRLPACQSCYTKKAKCDNARPKCTPCTRNGHACLTVSLDGSESVSREYIYALEQQVQTLQEDLSSSPNPVIDSGHASQTNPDTVSQAADAPRNDMSLSPNFTEGAGISFMSFLFTDARWREQNQKLLNNLSKRGSVLETGVQQNSLPAAEEALLVFNSYLSGSHVQTPFLLSSYVQGLYQHIFSGNLDSQNQHPGGGQISQHQLFRAFMILAIGSIPLYRASKHRYHPYGYFLAAMKHLEMDFLSKGLDSVQDLLLVSRFGIYYHIGTSIWELIQLSTRMCIEQGLHRYRTSANMSGKHLLDEQLRRRVFWQCYMMDRYTSVMLDRPPAISDRDIEIGFPANANDEELNIAGASAAFPDLDSFHRTSAPQADPTETTEMSVFFLCLRLRKITSMIHAKIQQKGSAAAERETSHIDLASASGTIYADLDELLLELQHWRRLAPVFPSPKCLYERQEWYDLLLMRERLLLIRKTIDLVPKRNNVPPRDLLCICLEYAVGTIKTFCALFDQNLVTYTRSYFQTLFTAGLSVMFCVSVVVDLDSLALVNATGAVNEAEKTLKQMAQELPDSIHYVAVYEALRIDILRKLKNFQRPDGFSGSSQAEQGNNCDAVFQKTDSQCENLTEFGVNPRGTSGMQEISAQLNSQWSAPTYDRTENQILSMQPQEAMIETSLLSWDIFGDNIFWSMEADMLGEYVYGKSGAAPFIDDDV